MITYLLLLAYYSLFVWLTWRHVRWGLFLVIGLLSSYMIRFAVGGLPTTLLEGMIGLLFIVWLIKIKKEKNLSFNPKVWLNNPVRDSQNPIPPKLRLPMVLFLVASTISVFVAPDIPVAAGIWKAYFIEPLMFLIVFVYTLRTAADLRKALSCLGLTVLVIGLIALMQKLTGALIPNPFWAEAAGRRVTTVFGYPNATALFVLPVIFLTLGQAIFNLRSTALNNLKLKSQDYFFLIFNIIVLVLGTLTILWTKSTGALLGLAAGLLCLLLVYKKTRLVVLWFILLGLIVSLVSPAVINKMQNTYASANEIRLAQHPSDLQIRVQMWRETLAMLKDSPIFGAGLAGYQTLIKPYHANQHLEIFLYPHNVFLNFWTEMGLLGLIAVVWILVVFFMMISRSLIFDLRHHQPDKTADYILTISALSAMLATLIYGLVDVPYFKNDLAVEFWMVVGIIIIINNRGQAAKYKKETIANEQN